MMHQYIPFSPTDIRFLGRAEAVEQIKQFVCNVPETVVLLSDRMQKILELDKWVHEAVSKDKAVHISVIPANPAISDVSTTLKLLADIEVKQVICVGGGSCIDLGKAICALQGLSSVTEISDVWVRGAITSKQYAARNNVPTLIAVPTTSGTGSEVTRWATIWDMEQKQKLSIDSVVLFPKVALMVPDFTVSLPQRLTLSTGLDALSHAMEAFWARSRTPLSQALATIAVQLVHQYLPQVLQFPNNLEARKGMCTASLMAGLAFSITRTTACHSISYPLTMHFGIEHGFAAALTLTQVAAQNATAVPEMEEILNLFGGMKQFGNWLQEICRPIQPLNLLAFGIVAEDLAVIVAQTFTQGRMDNNPVVFSEKEVESILWQCM